MPREGRASELAKPPGVNHQNFPNRFPVIPKSFLWSSLEVVLLTWQRQQLDKIASQHLASGGVALQAFSPAHVPRNTSE